MKSVAIAVFFQSCSTRSLWLEFRLYTLTHARSITSVVEFYCRRGSSWRYVSAGRGTWPRLSVCLRFCLRVPVSHSCSRHHLPLSLYKLCLVNRPERHPRSRYPIELDHVWAELCGMLPSLSARRYEVSVPSSKDEGRMGGGVVAGRLHMLSQA